MDRRSWPWKKKQSEKAVASPDSTLASLVSAASQGEQDSKKVNYVQISLESYTHLTELEEEVKTLNDKVNVLNEKLSVANSEITTKEALVKQHSKVAEDAVAGWEKAEAEALALKIQLESVTLSKLTAEDRASHLDGALKECMKQVRNLKEEHEHKLQETVLIKNRQCDRIKLEFEAKIDDLNQELLRSSAENAAISRSLQERSALLMKISEEKSQAEADIELLKSDIQSCEREMNSLKYEVHVVSKELEIRNEERNMSMRSAEVASKQHLEGVKKIAKLEAECQRLRGLVRKKLPGPAALAQMKLEVEHLGRDYGEPRNRRSPVKSFNPHLGSPPEFSLDNAQQCHKETEFLTARLLATEEETKMLKEALATRNSELQASRNMFAKAATKIRDFEAQLQVQNQHKSSRKLNFEMVNEGSSSQNASTPPSLTSISEDGIDEEGSSADCGATALMSDLSHLKKEKRVNKANKGDNANQVELMDDFLEMERLACSSTESYGAMSTPDSLTTKRTDNGDHGPSKEVSQTRNLQLEQKPGLDASATPFSSNEISVDKAESDMTQVSIAKLQSRISRLFESEAKGANTEKVLEGIKRVVQDMQEVLPPFSAGSDFKETHSADDTSNQEGLQPTGEIMENGISLSRDTKPGHSTELIIDQELSTAVSQIHDFVVLLGKEAMAIQDSSLGGYGLRQGIEEFSDSVSKVLCRKISLINFLLSLSQVLAKAGELSISVLGYKGSEGEVNSSDCVDKVTLLENKVVESDPLIEKFSNDSPQVCRSEVLQEGSSSPGLALNGASCLLEIEELKSEKETLVMELARFTENLEQTKVQLQETEQLVAELKSQLAASEKSNSLTETQLKCMAESYKSLETRAQALESEVNLVHTKLETRNNELQEEKRNHKDALAKCKDLQEQLQRSESCSTCALSSAADSKQEKGIADATEKLAECQETIFLLGRQLKALRPSVDQTESPYIEKHQMIENLMEDVDQTALENVVSSNVLPIEGSESPSHMFSSSMSPSDTEGNLILRSPINSKHKPTKSSSSSSPGLTPEKNSRGFSRFFSSKSKSGH